MSRAVSVDGTEIGYWTTGAGPPLVAVSGTPADHTRWRPLLPYLEPFVTVQAVDSVAAALPDARIVEIEGQEHVADALAPEMFARILLSFLQET